MLKRRWLIAALLALALTATGCADSGLEGAELYDQRCASCHGGDGSGGIGPAVGVGSPSVDLTDEQLEGAIRVGPGSMPSYDNLTDEQIDSLVAYMRALQSGS